MPTTRGAIATPAILAAIALAAAGCIERPADGDRDAVPSGIDGSLYGGGDAGEGSDAIAPPAGPFVELGAGAGAFVASPDGASIAVFHGAQGGYHVFVGLRIWNLLPGEPGDTTSEANPTTRVIATDAMGAVVSDRTRRTGYSPSSGVAGAFELADFPEQFTDGVCGCGLVGGPLTVTATVTDAAGATASAARTWMAVADVSCEPPELYCP